MTDSGRNLGLALNCVRFCTRAMQHWERYFWIGLAVVLFLVVVAGLLSLNNAEPLFTWVKP